MTASTTASPKPLIRSLADPSVQAEHLIDLGVHELAGLSERALRGLAADARGGADVVGGGRGLLVLHPDVLPASALVPLLEVGGRPGFVVTDMTDVDAFTAVPDLPDSPAHLVVDPQRGDEMANWSPDEADPAIAAAGRTPLLLTEGLYWLLHEPEVLQRGRCFMTTGSRLRKSGGALDPRTPALWFSNGTGRDGAERRNAPKVGWCWAGNRHTWLGMASAAQRLVIRSQIGS